MPCKQHRYTEDCTNGVHLVGPKAERRAEFWAEEVQSALLEMGLDESVCGVGQGQW